nr:hypothetical protein [Marinitoga lauensis]
MEILARRKKNNPVLIGEAGLEKVLLSKDWPKKLLMVMYLKY